MTRIPAILLFALALCPVSIAQPTSAPKEKAIIYFNQLKECKIYGTASGLKLLPIIGNKEQTSYVKLRNLRFYPREINLSIPDLTEPIYDLYIDGDFVGQKTKDEMAAGVPIKLEGTHIPQNYRIYFDRFKARCEAAAPRFNDSQDDSTQKANIMLTAMAKATADVEAADDVVRTVSIIIVPTGEALKLPGTGIIAHRDSGELSRTYLDSIQIARRDAVKLISNRIICNDVIDALTPLDFNLLLPAKFTPGGKSIVRGTFKNWTDRPVNGTAKIIVPKGWKVKNISTKLNMGGYSKTIEVKFEVTPPKKGAKPKLSDVTMIADLKVQDVQLRVQRTAKK